VASMKQYPWLFALCLCLVGCDPVYPPVIFNEYKAPIEISVSFKNAPAQTAIRIPPNSAFFQRHKNFVIEEIKVIEPSSNVRTYHSIDLEKARSNQNSDYEVWVLSETGLRFAGKKDLQKLRNAAR
jgi:hypothetical protein